MFRLIVPFEMQNLTAAEAGRSRPSRAGLCLGALIASASGCGNGSEPRGDADAGVADGSNPNAPERDASSGSEDMQRDAAFHDDASARSDAQTNKPGDDDAGHVPELRRSSGCNMSQTGTGDFETRTLQVGERTRTYHVRIPASYDPTRAYPLITRWHGSGGDGLSGGLDIQYAAGDDAIIVGADGIDERWSDGTRDDDLALFDALLSTLGENYCLDLARVFAYGFSAGAGFTNYLGCVRGDVLRGTAAVAGYKFFEDDQCTGHVAGWFLQDTLDDVSPLDGAAAARDRLASANGCSASVQDAGEDCVQYEGCADVYPVVWCQTSQYGHNIRGDYAPGAVWKFFSELP